MPRNLIDIIITTRNNYESLKKTLQSVSAQTLSDYNCYVADDHSSEDIVLQIKEEFPQVRLVESGSRNGPAKNRNRAIALGDAEFIAILDDDVVLAPDWLEEELRFISLSTAIAVAGSQVRFLDSKDALHTIGGSFYPYGLGYDLFFNRRLDEVGDYLKRPLRLVYACSAAMLIRRRAFEECGGFDGHYFYPAEDYDLGVRLNLLGYLSVYNPEAIVHHAFHKTVRSLSSQIFEYLPWRNSLATILKNFSFINQVRILPKLFLRIVRKKPEICLKMITWNIVNGFHILKRRIYIRKRTVINDDELMALSYFLARISAPVVNGIESGASVSRRRKSAALFYRAFVSLVGKLRGINKKSGYVENIIFQVTNICNAKCRHCFLRNILNKEIDKNLDLKEIEKFFASLGRVKNVVLGGGEPFFRQDLVEICAIIDKFSRPDIITIPTNGSLPEIIYKEVLGILENTRVTLKISLSLDAPFEEHDKLRGIDGLFAKVKETYDKLAFLYYIFYPRLEIQVNSVVFKDNYRHFPGLHDLIRSEFPLAQFSFEVIRGNYDKDMVEPLSIYEYERLVDSMRSASQKRDDSSLSAQLRLHCLALEALKTRRQPVSCNAARNFIVLDYSGNLYPCEILPSFANIRDIGYDFKNVLRDARWRDLINDIREKKCYCTHMCFLSTSLEEISNK